MPLRSFSFSLLGAAIFFLLAGAVTATPAMTPQTASARNSNALDGRALPDQLNDFGAFVDQVRKQFDVPGIAVAIVKDGKVVLEQGFGVRKLGESATVDAHTTFAIASNTKAFTAAALQILAERGKLKMDDRVIDHLPWFRMSDAYVTREMRIRDLLAHRSGLSLGAGDLLYFPPTSYTTKEVVQRLRDVPLANGFRSGYAYDNILFAVATEVIEQASGQSFADFVQQNLMQPIGMDESVIDYTHLKPGADVATGHAKEDFTKLVPVAPMAWLNVQGAGGIYASVHDMAKWMNVQLARGALPAAADGPARRVFSEDSSEQMWSMLTPIKIAPPSVAELAPTKPDFYGYGEGWFLSDYRGQKLVWHTGGWPGMVSRVTLVPSQHLGVVVLTNAEVTASFNAVTYRVLDAYLGAPKTDWIDAYTADVKRREAEANASMALHDAARAKGDSNVGPIDRYVGTYRDPWYGDVIVSKENGKLRLRFAKTAQLIGTLEPWQQLTFVVHWDDRSLNADAFLSFSLDPDGKVTEARMQLISPLTDFSFDFQDLRLKPLAKGNSG